jgi:hypothetical protein
LRFQISTVVCLVGSPLGESATVFSRLDCGLQDPGY